MKIVDAILERQGPELTRLLVERIGLARPEADRFLAPAVRSVVGALVEQPGINLSDFSTNFPPVMQKIDVAALAGSVGVEPRLARAGLSAMVPVLLTGLKQQAGGTDDLTAILDELREEEE